MHRDITSRVVAGLTSDVVVIGSGVAGLAATRRLLADGLSVTLLESGGLDYEHATAELNDGTSIGREYYSLRNARLRMFGGTTAIWGGRLARLDPIDLKRRPWIPHSGWPLSYDELAHWYRAALGEFGFPTDAFEEAECLIAEAGCALPAGRRVETATWLFDDQADRYSFRRCVDLVDHPRCTVLTHATALEILPGPTASSVGGVLVATADGEHVSFLANTVILAAGGIENPRLLLNSTSRSPDGLGNAYGMVGRFFMEHPHARGGRVVAAPAWRLFGAFKRGRRDGLTWAPLLKLSESVQRELGTLNSSLMIAGRRPPDGSESLGMRAYLRAKHNMVPDRVGRAIWRAVKGSALAAQSVTDPLRPFLLHRLGILDAALVVRAEQAPDPESRVVIQEERDRYGARKVSLDWRVCRLDVRSVRCLVEEVGRALTDAGLGRVEPAPWLSGEEWETDALISAHPIGGYHHMGTTRMSARPQDGVTDDSGRVHGVENLYVVGSSVFPTSGWANPTLTIVALSLRTASIVSNRARRSSGSVDRPETFTGERRNLAAQPYR